MLRRSDRRRVLPLALAGALAFATGCPEPAHVHEEWPVLGATLSVELHVAVERDARACIDDLREQAAAVEASVSAADGELARLNASAADDYFAVGNLDLYRLIRLALDYAQFSRGAYDPTVGPLKRLYHRGSGRLPTPTELQVVQQSVGWSKVVVAPEARALRFTHPQMELDLGPVDRGFALDAGARAFARPGMRGALLRLGDSVLVWGASPGREDWEVRLGDPRVPARGFATLRTTDRSIGLAGHPEHGLPAIFDAASGRPASSDVIVAVAVADSAADAAALAVALFVGGSARGGDLVSRMIRAEAVLLVAGNGAPEILASASLRDRLVLSPEVAAEVEGRVRYILPPESIDLESPLAGGRP